MFRIRILKRYKIVILAFLGNLLFYQLQDVNTLLNIIPQEKLPNLDVSVEELALYSGCACACFVGVLGTRFGGAFTFGLAIALSAIANLLTVYALKLGYWWVVGIRFLNGIFYASALSAFPDIWSRWSPPGERSRMVIVSYSGLYFGPIVHQILVQFNFEIKSHLHEIILLIWSIVWLIYVRNDPVHDNFLSHTEKQYLIVKVGMADRERHGVNTYPLASILTLRPLWILSFTSFVLEIGVKFSSLLPFPVILEKMKVEYVVQLSTLIHSYLCFGYVADYASRRKHYTPTQIRKFYICSGFVFGAVSLMATFIGKLGTATFSLLFQQSRALVETALLVNVIDLSPRYSSVLYGIQKTFNILLYVIGGAIVTPLAIQEKYGQTGGIICIILLYISTALLYYTWGSAELQPWNATENEEYELEVPKVHDNAESQPESQPESESEPEPEPEPVELK